LAVDEGPASLCESLSPEPRKAVKVPFSRDNGLSKVKDGLNNTRMSAKHEWEPYGN